MASGAPEVDSGPTPGSNGPNTRLVAGNHADERRLTVDFDGFIGRLETIPGLDYERLARYLAGADLIRGLAGPPDEGFGRSAPGVSGEAEISEQLYAITDEALAAAEDVMEAVHTHQDDYFIVQADRDRQPELTPELRLALTELGNDGSAAARSALSQAPCATERAVAGEFI